MSVTSGICDSPASSIQSAPQTRSQPRRWTAAEDKFLTQLVAKFGDKRGSNGHWKEISSRFNARTAKDCRKRWFHSLDPSLRKGRWCESEDRILLDAYNQLGPAWRDIALLLPGRKDDQCSKRYREILSPAVRNRLCEWTSEEDELLLEGVRSFGHSWSTISARIPGRPPLTCRNRWRVVSKKSL
ncbi:Homeodomain-like protein, partial [Diaporthe sp. PMI_573]